MLGVRTAQTGSARPSTRPFRRSLGAAWALGAVGALVGFAGSWIPSYWGDEAASVMSAERSWSSLSGVLGRIDAVHGVYYALLHLWVRAVGTSEIATRLPSALAVGVAVAGTVVLVAELTTTRTAIIAGVVCIALPRSTYMATEARSYALGTAAAVWLTVLLVRLTRRRSGIRAWMGYVLAAAACIYLFLYLGLILIVHAAYVLVAHRDQVVLWLRACGLALLLAAPIVVIGYLQREQIAFLARRDYATPRNVFIAQWFGDPLIAVIGWTLITTAAAGLLYAVAGGDGAIPVMLRSRRRLAGLALIWLLVPTCVLLWVNAVIAPVYNVRYLSMCTPAAAILVALGSEVIAAWAAPRLRAAVSIALVAALVIACIPVYGGQRTPWAKDRGSDWRAAAEYLSQHAREGDLIIFDQSTRPSRDPRLMTALYPDRLAGLQDIALTTPYTQRTRLWDAVQPNAAAVSLRSGPASIWAVEVPAAHARPDDITMLLHLGFSVEATQRIHRSTVYHLIRE